jgi:NitT/TauT family transport system substrate-binding protein
VAEQSTTTTGKEENEMDLKRRNFVGGLGAFGAATAIGVPSKRASAATPVKLTLPWLPLGTFSYTFVAKKLGYFEKRGLDVTIDRGFGSTRVCVPVDQGQYDFGLLDLAVMAGCAGKGLDLTAIAGVWPRSPIGIFSLKELSITKPKDLEGQSIGFVTGGGEFQLWPAFVKATGIDATKINIVSMDPAGLMRAAADKQIKVVGNFFGSIAPTFWANKIDINAMFYEDYGVKMYSIVLACKKATLQNRSELCKGIVEALMEGLKYVYLNPEKAIDLHVESLKEFQGGSPGTREVLTFGQEIGTSLGFVPSFKANGLGFMDPDLVAATRESVESYMDIKPLPPVAKLFTNQFVGSVKLTDAEWAQVEQRVRSTLPTMRG